LRQMTRGRSPGAVVFAASESQNLPRGSESDRDRFPILRTSTHCVRGCHVCGVKFGLGRTTISSAGTDASRQRPSGLSRAAHGLRLRSPSGHEIEPTTSRRRHNALEKSSSVSAAPASEKDQSVNFWFAGSRSRSDRLTAALPPINV
jgi:hypothetical protein